MHKDDHMTPVERLGNFWAGRDMDRILAMPLICSMSGKATGMTHKQKRSTAITEAYCQIEAYKRFGNDLLIADYGLHSIGSALGSVMGDPEDAVPAVERHVLQELKDIGQLDFDRCRLKNDPKFQKHLDCAKILINEMGKEVPTAVLIAGPFTSVSSIYPIDKLLKATVRDPKAVHRLMRLCTDTLREVHNEFIKAGAMILVCEPVATGTMISVGAYKEFVKPYTIELMSNIHAKGGIVCYHICGDAKTILAEMVETRPDMISIDNRVRIDFAKSIVGPQMPLAGNIDPVDIMILGSTKDVDEACRQCIQDAYGSAHGYVLCTGCDLNGDVPLENLDAFMAAARKYGKYPVTPKNWMN